MTRRHISIEKQEDGRKLTANLNNLSIHIINRRQDVIRRRFMEAQLTKADLSYDFLEAVENPKAFCQTEHDILPLLNSGLAKAEIAVTLSHIELWKVFLQGEREYCIVLEDDVVCSPQFASIVEGIRMPREALSIYRLETHLASCLINRDASFDSVENEYQLHRLYNNHCGTAAYLINRATAQYLWNLRKVFTKPIDTELFDPNQCTVPMPTVYQMVPAPCIQEIVFAIAENRCSQLGTTIGGGRSQLPKSYIKSRLRQAMNRILSVPLRKDGLKRSVIPFK